MSEQSGGQLATAVSDFRRLRRRADMERLLAGLTGKSADLLNFDEVRRKLRATAASERQLREIPLDAIVGSVGRYQDFSRSFLPRNDSDQDRWARVMVATQHMAGLPPIEVYQLGDAYFVVDGNHRVSVALQNGAKTIQAYVMPFRSRVPLATTVRAKDLVIHAEQAEFLAATHLDEARPEAHLQLTEAGGYHILREHIAVHSYYLTQERKQQVALEEAAALWYDNIYMPVVQLIRERGLLREFPERTEADLYLWLSEHRAELETQLGWEISADRAAIDLAQRQVNRLGPLGEHMLEMILPEELEPTPEAGAWRRGLGASSESWLFNEVLVPLSGEPAGWEALEQALVLAHRERSRLYGLHVLRDETQRASNVALALQEEFARRCAAAGVDGRLALEVGPVARTIRERSRWADLVVLQISYPPEPRPLARLASGLHSLIRTSIRPVLTVSQALHTLQRLLLAYDGSPKAEEALFLATYLALRWQTALTVLTVSEPRQPSVEGARIRAKAYLRDHGVEAEFVTATGSAAAVILATAERTQSDVVVLGGSGHGAVGDLMLGSVAEEVLRTRRLPTLLCP